MASKSISDGSRLVAIVGFHMLDRSPVYVYPAAHAVT
jgi:hypothetical protein